MLIESAFTNPPIARSLTMAVDSRHKVFISTHSGRFLPPFFRADLGGANVMPSPNGMFALFLITLTFIHRIGHDNMHPLFAVAVVKRIKFHN